MAERENLEKPLLEFDLGCSCNRERILAPVREIGLLRSGSGRLQLRKIAEEIGQFGRQAPPPYDRPLIETSVEEPEIASAVRRPPLGSEKTNRWPARPGECLPHKSARPFEIALFARTFAGGSGPRNRSDPLLQRGTSGHFGRDDLRLASPDKGQNCRLSFTRPVWSV